MLDEIEKWALTVGLRINRKKTEYMLFGNWSTDQPHQKLSLSTGDIQIASDFKYLGCWIKSVEKNLSVRIAMAWDAVKRMRKVWNSDIERPLRISLFRSTVETVLLYGAETWALTQTLETKLDGTYTKLLRYIFQRHWSEHVTNVELYGDLPKLSTKLKQRKLTFAGHCYRAKDQFVSDLVFLQRPEERFYRGQQFKFTYEKSIIKDLGVYTGYIDAQYVYSKGHCRYTK